MEKGEFASAVGPSGSGKTTLLNLIGTLDTPDSGAIRIGELEITTTPADFRLRHLGFVFQSFNLFPLTPLWKLEMYEVTDLTGEFHGLSDLAYVEFVLHFR